MYEGAVRIASVTSPRIAPWCWQDDVNSDHFLCAAVRTAAGQRHRTRQRRARKRQGEGSGKVALLVKASKRVVRGDGKMPAGTFYAFPDVRKSASERCLTCMELAMLLIGRRRR